MTALFPDRPKGMHRQTYQRLQSAALNAEISAEERLVFVLARRRAWIGGATVDPLVGRKGGSEHERGGECGNAPRSRGW